MKKAVAVVFNDLHIKRDNRDQILDLMSQLVKLTQSLNLDEVYGLGDFFESRNEQPLFNLTTMDSILEIFEAGGITLNAIPGNHDKVDYRAKESYLDSYRHHPAMRLVRDSHIDVIDGLKYPVLLVPFFSNEQWMKEVDRYIDKPNMILFSHTAFNGSVNNDGTEVDTGISLEVAKRFKAVFLGHYHNTHTVGKNVFHLPSTHQNNHGENPDKGFTVIYDDLSYDIVRTKFKEYKTVSIDTTSLSIAEVNKLIDRAQKFQSNGNDVRIKITGEQDQLKSIDLTSIKRSGISVDVVQKDIEASIDCAEDGKVVEFDSSSIQEEFDKFCDGKGYTDKGTGLSYLLKKLKLS